jgi:hypothetical protein
VPADTRGREHPPIGSNSDGSLTLEKDGWQESRMTLRSLPEIARSGSAPVDTSDARWSSIAGAGGRGWKRSLAHSSECERNRAGASAGSLSGRVRCLRRREVLRQLGRSPSGGCHHASGVQVGLTHIKPLALMSFGTCGSLRSMCAHK